MRAGKVSDAAKVLKGVLKADIPRAHVAAVASVARRVGLPGSALRMLGRYVRPFEKESVGLARPSEVIQYASTLIYIGATREGLSLLSTLSAEKHPDLLFHRALGLISEWRYGESIPPLESYLERKGLPPYQRMVARVNLLAALIFEMRAAEASALFRSLVDETGSVGMGLLHGNVLQLGVILKIETAEWREAGELLDRAETVFAESPRNLRLLAKWRAVVRLSSVNKNRGVTDLRRLREDAVAGKQWELSRDCEKYIALAERDKSAFAKLYFGTPYDNYRRHLLREWGKPIQVPSDFVWWLGSSHGPRVDVRRAEIDGKALFKKGGVLHYLLRALCQDFYRPVRVAELHARVFPEDRYHPDASPARIKSAVIRLRKAFAEAGHPAAILAHGDGYHFNPALSVGLVLSRDHLLTATDEGLERLAARWPRDAFGALDAAGELGLPRRSVFRLLKTAVAEGRLQREGRGKSSRYRFPAGSSRK